MLFRSVQPTDLPAFAARYRFFFNPIRYTSLGLAVCEAMLIGMPVLGLATTEMVTVVANGVCGYLATDPGRLVGPMRRLLRDPEEARRLGEGARRVARERFDIRRFVRDWEEAFAQVVGRPAGDAASASQSESIQARSAGDGIPSPALRACVRQVGGAS